MSSSQMNTHATLDVKQGGLTKLPKLDTRQPSLVKQGRRALDMSDVIKSQGRLTLYEVMEAAEVLRVSRWMIYELIRSHELKSMKIGSRRLIAPDDLLEFINQCKEQGS